MNWTGRWLNKSALAQVRRLAEAGGPPQDLVLCYRDKSGDVTGWENFVTRVVRDYGGRFAAAVREQTLPIAGIAASTPVRICESGWPTGPGRPEAVQAQVLEATLRAVHEGRAELNVTHWELFSLRDANSSKDDMFYRFRVLRDLIAELRRG